MPKKKAKGTPVAKTTGTDISALKAVLNYRVSMVREDIGNLEFKKSELTQTLEEIKDRLEELRRRERTAMQELLVQCKEYGDLTTSHLSKQDVVNFMKESWKLKHEQQEELDRLSATIENLRTEIKNIEQNINELHIFKEEIKPQNEKIINQLTRENEATIERTESTIQYLNETHQRFLETSEKTLKATLASVENQAFEKTFIPLEKWFNKDVAEHEALKKELEVTCREEAKLREVLSMLEENHIKGSEEMMKGTLLRQLHPEMYAHFDLTGKENLRKDKTLGLQFEKYFRPNGQYAVNSIFDQSTLGIRTSQDAATSKVPVDELIDQISEIELLKEGACDAKLNEMLQHQYSNQGWKNVFSVEPWDDKFLVVSGSTAKWHEPPAPDKTEEDYAERFDPRTVKFPSTIS